MPRTPPQILSAKITDTGTITITREGGADVVVSAATDHPWHRWPDRALVEDGATKAVDMPDIRDVVKALRRQKPEQKLHSGE